MKSMAEKTMMENLLTQKTQNSQSKYKWNIVWRNVISLTYLHIAGFYGLYIAFTDAKFYTFLWNLTVAVFAALGITAGAHRLWAHRCYKAKLPMRVILMILETTAFQNHIYEWVRDHRVHHKFVDTDADPYNAKRGFFFSHVGWLMVRKHPDVISKGATVDMSDLDKDPVVTWQRKYYSVLMPLFCFVLPMWVSIYFWDEKPIYAWYIVVAKYIFQVNITWSINSAAHYWGTKPFDNTVTATDSYLVGISGFGEGWHNYHHAFPWDYKTAEFGNYRTNLTCAFIDFFVWLGWAYDLKTVNHDIIKRRAARTGDGSLYERTSDEHTQEKFTWGWNDADMSLEDKQAAEILNKSD